MVDRKKIRLWWQLVAPGIFVLGASLFFAGLLSRQIMREGGQMIALQSESGKFSMLYPENWLMHQFEPISTCDKCDKQTVALFDNPKGLSRGISGEIRIENFPSGTLAQVANWGAGYATQKDGYVLESLAPSKFNGEDVLVRHYTYREISFPSFQWRIRECLDAYRLHNAEGYDLSFCAPQEDFQAVKSIFDEMNQSFAYH